MSWLKTLFQQKPAVMPESTHPPLDAQQLNNIWRLTSLPEAEFDRVYGSFFSNVHQYLNAEPIGGWPKDRDIRHTYLPQVCEALRHRQAKIIPPHVPVEDAARLSEIMTFVVALSSVLEQVGNLVSALELDSHTSLTWCPWREPVPPLELARWHDPVPGYGLLLLPQLVSEDGQRWLCQEPHAQAELVRYFSAKSQSAMSGIISHQSTVEAATQPATTTTTEVKPPAVTGKTRSGAGGWKVIDRIKEALRRGELSVNQRDSLYQITPHRQVFVRMPEAMDWVAAQTDEKQSTVKNRLDRLKLHRSTDGGKHNLFKGCIDGKHKPVKGAIYPIALFFDKPPGPSDVFTLVEKKPMQNTQTQETISDGT